MRTKLSRSGATVCGTILISCGGASSVPSSQHGANGGAAGIAGAPAAGGARNAGGLGNDEGGAGPEDGFPEAYVSGSRLRAMYWVAADQTRQFISWYDSKLDTPCIFAPAEDKVTRCVPITWVTIGSDATFADSSCMRPFGSGRVEDSCGPHRYVRSFTDAAIYEIGAELPLTNVYTQQSACTASPVQPNELYYSLGRKLDATEFVAAEWQNASTGQRLNFLGFVADDGTKQRVYWYDARLKSRCFLATATDMKLHCLPVAASNNPNVFSDDRCTNPAVTSTPAPYVDAVYAEVQEGDCETQRVHVYSVGQQLSGPVFQLVAGSCVQSPQAAGTTLYAAGSELDPATFDEFDEVVLGAGRLQLAALRDSDGAIELPPTGRGITDSTLGTACAFGQTADGKDHCIPLAMDRAFSDASCTQALAFSGGQACGASVPQYVEWHSGEACTGGMALARLGDASAAPSAAFTETGLGCSAISVPATTFYTLGAEIDSATLESAEIRTE